jgi:hypothetical protein
VFCGLWPDGGAPQLTKNFTVAPAVWRLVGHQKFFACGAQFFLGFLVLKQNGTFFNATKYYNASFSF